MIAPEQQKELDAWVVSSLTTQGSPDYVNGFNTAIQFAIKAILGNMSTWESYQEQIRILRAQEPGYRRDDDIKSRNERELGYSIQ